MTQSLGTTAASAQLAAAGNITGFSSSASSGVLVSFVFCSGSETSSGAFTMSGGSLTWGYVCGYLSGTNQSILVYSASFSSTITSTTFTLTPHSPVSSRFGFILVECEGSTNTFEPSNPAIAIPQSTSLQIQNPTPHITTRTSSSGQPTLIANNPQNAAVNDTVILNPGGGSQETRVIQSISGTTSMTFTTNMANNHGNGEAVNISLATANANDMILCAIMDEAGGSDTIVGAGGYTTAISTTNYNANIGAACGVIYQVVTSTSTTNNPQATITNSATCVMLGVAIEATSAATTTSGAMGVAMVASVVVSGVVSGTASIDMGTNSPPGVSLSQVTAGAMDVSMSPAETISQVVSGSTAVQLSGVEVTGDVVAGSMSVAESPTDIINQATTGSVGIVMAAGAPGLSQVTVGSMTVALAGVGSIPTSFPNRRTISAKIPTKVVSVRCTPHHA